MPPSSSPRPSWSSGNGKRETGNEASLCPQVSVKSSPSFVVFRFPFSVSRLSIARLVVAHVTGGGDGRRLRGGEYIHRLHPAVDTLPRAGDVELLEEKPELRLERGADGFARPVGEVPKLLLEGADRELARLVQELALGFVLLPLASLVSKEPPLGLALQGEGERRVLVDHVLELGREVDLGALVVGEMAEELRGERRGAVLDRPRETVFLPRDPGDLPERLEVDGHAKDRSVWPDQAAVRRACLNRNLGDAFPAPERREVSVHVGPELLGRRVLLADLADLAADGDRHLHGLARPDELRQAGGGLEVLPLLLGEGRPGQIHERRGVDVDLEEPGRDGLVDEGLDRGDLALRVFLHLLRVGLVVVPLEEDRTFPSFADRGRQDDRGVFRGPLIRVADLATRDLEDERPGVERERGAEGGAPRVVGEHADVDGGNAEPGDFAAAAGLVERKDRDGQDFQRTRRLADRAPRRVPDGGLAEDRGPDEAVHDPAPELRRPRHAQRPVPLDCFRTA